MREINVSVVKKAIKEMALKACIILSADVHEKLRDARNKETSPLGIAELDNLLTNADLAASKNMPICQDTGMAVVWVEVGQDVHFIGGDFNDAINEGVREAYSEGFLRKSVLDDPLLRKNTGDNTPSIVHVELVPGDQVHIHYTAKGFGSENMSAIKMLNPSDGRQGVVDFVLETVKKAGPNPCPPIIVGVGLGGTFEKAALLSKKALFRDAGSSSDKPHLAELEKELLERINELGIGPQGLGGLTTALAVQVESYPTHIAGLPVAVNISCHATRHLACVI